MTQLLAVLLAALGTYGVRAASVHVTARVDLPPRLERGFRHAAAAVLASLVSSSVVEAGRSDGSAGLPAVLVAVVVAGLLARRGVGMAWVLLLGVTAGWAAGFVGAALG